MPLEDLIQEIVEAAEDLPPPPKNNRQNFSRRR
jgi:hypothetical protein